MNDVLRIAGVRFALQGQASFLEVLRRGWAPFFVRAPADVTVEVETSGPPVPEPRMQLPVAALAGGRIAGADFEASLEDGGRCVRVRGPDAFYPLDSVLKVLVGLHVARAGGLVVHGVALAHEGRAALFTGESGAGKSTLGSCGGAGGLALLSDELVAVRPSAAGGFEAHGTPWNVGHPAHAPLAVVGLLAHAPVDRFEVVPPSEVLRVLSSNVLLAEETAAARAQLIRSAAALLGQVRTARLHFAPAPAVADALRTALAG